MTKPRTVNRIATFFAAMAAGAMILGGWVVSDIVGHDTGAQRHPSARVAPAGPPIAAETPVVVAHLSDIPSAAVELDKRLTRLGRDFRGDVGLAVRDVQTGWTSDHRGLDHFPQQSVSKLWVAIAALHQADLGRLDLTGELTVRREDLTLFHQPIRALALRPGGYRTTAEDLLVRALADSDNSANDRLLNQIGGPAMVRTTLAAKGLSGIRFGPGERKLQAGIAGLDWKQSYALGNAFHAARDTIENDARRAAFDAYVADPIDGATPIAMVDALARLQQGKLLSPASTTRLLSIMSHSKTGPNRLKGGLHDGWTLSHKTGTGQVLQGEQAGYNDVGILTSPDGHSYAVAVLIGRTSRPLRERMKLMQQVVAATIAYDAQLAAQRSVAADPPEDKGVTIP